jgi:hypothetical protein
MLQNLFHDQPEVKLCSLFDDTYERIIIEIKAVKLCSKNNQTSRGKKGDCAPDGDGV